MLDADPLTRRDFTRLAAAAALAPASVRARPGQERAVVIDALASPGPFNVPDRTARPLTDEMLANAGASGITAVNVTVNASGSGRAAWEGTIRELAYWSREQAAHPDVLMQVRTVADLHAARDQRRLGLVWGFQDAVMLEGDVARLDLFHDFGVRIIQLTYNQRNDLGDGCLEPGNAGLSRFGNDTVARMNEIGILVDLSHCGQRTTADAIRAAAEPVAITHSGCDTVYAHPRNKRDEELRALADRGGVVGIYMMPFLNAQGPPRLEHFVRHLEHAINVCGEEHVGVGSDNSITPTVADAAYRSQLAAFAGERARRGIGAPRENELLFVDELNTPHRMGTLGEHLRARGHSAARVDRILGANWRRLFQQVWR
jgi:membrane dipeptidase